MRSTGNVPGVMRNDGIELEGYAKMRNTGIVPEDMRNTGFEQECYAKYRVSGRAIKISKRDS